MIDNLKEAIEHAKEVAENWKSQLVNCVSEEGRNKCLECVAEHEQLAAWLTELAERREADRWIPVSERTPNDLEPVNITWINHDPEPYYKEIKDKPFTATGVYFNGQWYWWSTLCTDTLAEYSHNYDDIIDKDIEVTAWKPLPKPYESEEKEDQPERKAYDGRKVGDETVNDDGIYRVTKIDGYACYEAVRIMTKEAFTEAYNKYIANDN